MNCYYEYWLIILSIHPTQFPPTMCPETLFKVINNFLRNDLTNFQFEGGFWYIHFKGFKSVFDTHSDILLNHEVSKIILKMVGCRASLLKLKKWLGDGCHSAQTSKCTTSSSSHCSCRNSKRGRSLYLLLQSGW